MSAGGSRPSHASQSRRGPSDSRGGFRPEAKNPFRSVREDRPEKQTHLHRPVAHVALKALASVILEGKYADRVIEKAFKTEKSMGGRDRKAFAELVYELVRWYRRYGYAIEFDTETQKPSETELWGWIAAFLVEKSIRETAIPSLPNWPEVSAYRAERIATRLAELERERAPEALAIQESIPDWMNEIGIEELRSHWPRFLRDLNRQAPVILRANSLKCTRDELRARLDEEEGIATDFAYETECGLILKERRNIFSSPAFKEGWFEVQDGASQQVADLLDAQPGERIIDACAGAGGKTLAIAAHMQNKGKLIALDVSEKKIEELKRRVRRAGIDTVEARLIESGKTIKRLEGSADRVLLDVPCSGLGVLRRNPDAKWKLSIEEVVRLRELQAEILNEYSSMVKPGGTLVYATCSILPSENEKQVQAFLKRQPRFKLVRERHFDPGVNGYDGFYAAVMKLS